MGPSYLNYYTTNVLLEKSIKVFSEPSEPKYD